MSFQNNFSSLFENEFSSPAQSAPLSGVQGVHFKNNLSAVSIIGHVVVWVLLAVVTLSLAMFVYPYYMQRYIINNTDVFNAEGHKIGQLKCDINLANIIGNIVVWVTFYAITQWILYYIYMYKYNIDVRVMFSIVTLGILYVVFMYKIHAHCYSHTKIITPD